MRQLRHAAAVLTASGLMASVAAGQCPVAHFQGLLPDTESHFGAGMAVANDWVVASDPVVDQDAKGHVLIYRRRGVEWAHAFTLHDPAAIQTDFFGRRVRLEGDQLLVTNTSAQEACVKGAVYVYRFIGGDWILDQTIVPSDCSMLDFASAIDLEGGRALIGASSALNAEDEEVGAAYVYTLREGSASLEGVLTDPDGEEDDYFGRAVSLHGDVALVTALGDGHPINSGSATFFRRSADGVWVHEQKVTHELPGDPWFGAAVALHGDLAVVGAPHGGVQAQGKAVVYEYLGGVWEQTALLSAIPGFSFGGFGESVDISPAGDAIYIGSSSGPDRVWVFERDDRGAWVEAYVILAEPDSPPGFGTVTVGGDFILIGAWDNAYLYAAKDASDCNGDGVADACSIASGASLDSDGDGVPDDCDDGAAADFDRSGVVDGADLGTLLGAWGPCRASCPADLDGNGTVESGDLALLLGAWGPVGTALVCPGTGDCCAPSGQPGCDDETCCAAVCAADPFCCLTSWDGLCASEARDKCGCPGFAACEGATGDCCCPSGHAAPGCSDAACCGVVCALDPYCCEGSWDKLCWLFADAHCNCPAPPPPFCGPGSGDCCEPHDHPGCNDVTCCMEICAFDPSCCEGSWDGLCAAWASINCDDGACGDRFPCE